MASKNPPNPVDFDDIEDYRLAFCKFVYENPEFAQRSDFEDQLPKLQNQRLDLRRTEKDLFETSLWPEIELHTSSDDSESNLISPSNREPDHESVQGPNSCEVSVPSVDSSFLTDETSSPPEPPNNSSAKDISVEMELQNLREVSSMIDAQVTPEDNTRSARRRLRDRKKTKRLVSISLSVTAVLLIVLGCEWQIIISVCLES